MGLLDDLAMGFGLKERTEDYDARTARTIARAEGVSVGESRAAQQFLGSRGRDNYNPQIAQDNRSFGQRFMFSPESAPSPTPYAIGPLAMSQPLPKFGILGMLSGLGGLLGGNTQQMGPPRTTVRPMLRPDGFTPPTFPTGNGQPETTFTENLDGVELAEVEKPMPVDALNTLVTSALQNVPDAPATPSLAADPTGVQRLPITNPGRVVVDDSNLKPYLPNDGLLSPAFGPGDTGYYDQQMNMGVGTDQLFTPQLPGLTLITTGPHAGKYIDANGRLVMP